MPRTIIKLTDFDPEPIIEYAISVTDITNVYHYLLAMQRDFWPGTWEDICIGGYYGASALLHEVVELRLLLSREPYLLTRREPAIRALARDPGNRDAHLRAVEVEYRYLQRTIERLFNTKINIGAIVQANAQRQTDWDDLFDTSLPFFDPSQAEIEQAERFLTQLRSMGKRLK